MSRPSPVRLHDMQVKAMVAQLRQRRGGKTDALRLLGDHFGFASDEGWPRWAVLQRRSLLLGLGYGLQVVDGLQRFRGRDRVQYEHEFRAAASLFECLDWWCDGWDE